jgi:hypothetical protein
MSRRGQAISNAEPGERKRRAGIAAPRTFAAHFCTNS